MLKSQHETPIINPDNSVTAVNIMLPAIMPATMFASTSIMFSAPFFVVVFCRPGQFLAGGLLVKR
jgi:hypothetical protein